MWLNQSCGAWGWLRGFEFEVLSLLERKLARQLSYAQYDVGNTEVSHINIGLIYIDLIEHHKRVTEHSRLCFGYCLRKVEKTQTLSTTP